MRRAVVISGLATVAAFGSLGLLAATNAESDPYGLTCKSDSRKVGTYEFEDDKVGVASTPADAAERAQMWKAFEIPEESWRVVEDSDAALAQGGLVPFEVTELSSDAQPSIQVTHVYKVFDPSGDSRLAVLVSQVGDGYRVEGYVAC